MDSRDRIKFTFLLLSSLLVFSGAACSSGGSSGDPSGAAGGGAKGDGDGDGDGSGDGDGDGDGDETVSGVTVGFVSARVPLGGTDLAIADYLAEFGYEVVPLQPTHVTTDLEADLILMSSTLASSAVTPLYAAIEIPIVSWENFGFETMRMGSNPEFTPGTKIEIVDSEHPLAAGLSGEVEVYESPLNRRSVNVPESAEVVATMPGSPDQVVLFGYAKGSKLISGLAPARRVGFFFDDDGFSAASDDGLKLFRAAIDWALVPPQAVDAGPDSITGFVNAPIELSGSLDDESAMSSWSVVSGPGDVTFLDEGAPLTKFFVDEPGTYVLELSVEDSDDSDTITVEVAPSNGPSILFLVGDDAALNDSDRMVAHQLAVEEGLGVGLGTGSASENEAFGYQLAVISSSVKELSDYWATAPIPVLSWAAALYEQLDFAASAGSFVNDDFLQITDDGHPAAGGLSGDAPVRFTRSGNPRTVDADDLGDGVVVIGEVDSSPSYFVYDEGEATPGGTAPARRVALPFGTASAGSLTADGKDLLRGAINWASDRETEPRVRIFPLGDSITRGTGMSYSYRRPLWEMLVEDGCQFDFVGSLFGPVQGSTLDAFDADNDGHGGYTTKNILNELSDYLEGNVPDVVLIHLGTNDLLQEVELTESMMNLETIITTVRDQNPDVTILLAQIIGGSDPNVSNNVQTYNEGVATLADSLDTSDSPIEVVDLYSVYDYVEFNQDDLHPNSEGDAILAEGWYEALEPLASCP